jgi:hypothetical protein
MRGVGVRIEQQTEYPFADRVVMKIDVDKPVAFDLVLRVPLNSGKVQVAAASGATVQRDARYIRVAKEWCAGDEVTVDFDFQVVRQIPPAGQQAYYERGPLVFSLAFPAKEEVRENLVSVSGKVSGFSEYLVRPESTLGWDYRIDPQARFERVALAGDPQHPWVRPPLGLKGTLLDAQGQPVAVTLLPMGATLLRRTTFPLDATAAVPSAKKDDAALDVDKDPMRTY